MKSRIAVIGAGIAGIHCTSELIKLGYHVDLYEKSDRIGGRMKTELIEGFQIDLHNQPVVHHCYCIKHCIEVRSGNLDHELFL